MVRTLNYFRSTQPRLIHNTHSKRGNVVSSVFSEPAAARKTGCAIRHHSLKMDTLQAYGRAVP